MSRAFTIIELLVVVTIIVVLLALLTPAIDKSIYQAELAVCATRLKGIAGGATVYTMDHKRSYPSRFWITNNRQPDKLAGVHNSTPQTYGDDRPSFNGYISMSLLHDPFAKAVELENTEPMTDVYTPYKLWFGWRYVDRDRGNRLQKGMYRLGDRFEWKDRRFRVIAGDGDQYDTDQTRLLSSHPDRDQLMVPWIAENEWGTPPAIPNFYLSMWETRQGRRGLLDLNFAFDDGSVVRVANLGIDDEERTAAVPEYTPTDEAFAATDYTRVAK